MTNQRIHGYRKIKNATIKVFLFLLASLLTFNFTFSLIIWFISIRASYSKNMTYWPEVLHALIIIVLWCTSIAAFILVLSKKNRTQRPVVLLLLITLALSGCCFVYDTQYSTWSTSAVPIFVKMSEQYYGGYRFRFINWPWYEKDIISEGAFKESKVFHHFFGHRPKGYISSSTLTYIGEPEETVEAQ